MRFAAWGVLLAVAALVAFLLLAGGGGYRYQLLFQSAGQLVKGNQVLIGGLPAGSISGIEVTPHDLAQVDIEVDQQLHEGTTAVIRATSLSGEANHYVSIAPGPNSAPALPSGASLGLASTTTSVDIDQLFNTFPPRTRRGLGEVIRGTAAVYAGKGPEANQTYKYLDPALSQTDRLLAELTRDQGALRDFVDASSRTFTAIAARGRELSDGVSAANRAFGAIADQNSSLDLTLRRLAPTLRQGSTTFVNLRAALGDLTPLVDTAKPATRHLASFLADLRPVIAKAEPTFADLADVVRRPGPGNDLADLTSALPSIERRAKNGFRQTRRAVGDIGPTVDFARPYSPDILNALTKLGQVTAYYDADGHYARASAADLNLFRYDAGTLEPIPPSQQFGAFGSPTVPRRCPGGATQPAPDRSNPFVGPLWPSSGLTAADCNPSDLPPGP